METFGERLKHLRGRQSQAAFAALLGIPQVTLGNYERNRNQPRFELIQEICSRFEISVEWLLFGTGSMRREPVRPKPAGGTAGPPAELLEARLEELEREQRELNAERRELSAENRQLHRDKALLLETIGELRAVIARLEERERFLPAPERTDSPREPVAD